MMTGHTFETVGYIGQATPMLLIALAMMIIIFTQQIAYPYLVK
jgi:hypothetical protein